MITPFQHLFMRDMLEDFVFTKVWSQKKAMKRSVITGRKVNQIGSNFCDILKLAK